MLFSYDLNKFHEIKHLTYGQYIHQQLEMYNMKTGPGTFHCVPGPVFYFPGSLSRSCSNAPFSHAGKGTSVRATFSRMEMPSLAM